MERIIRLIEDGGRCIVCGRQGRWLVRPSNVVEGAAALLCRQHAELAPREWSVFWVIAGAAGWPIGEQWEELLAAPPLLVTGDGDQSGLDVAAVEPLATGLDEGRSAESRTPGQGDSSKSGSPARTMQGDLRAAFEHARDRARRVPDAVRRQLGD